MPIRRKETAWLEILNDQISIPSSLPTIAIYRNNTKSLSNPLSLSTEAVSHSISPQIRSQLLINHLTEIPSLNILLNSLPTTTDSLTALNRAVLVCDFFYKVLKIGLLSEEKGGTTPLPRFFAIVCTPGYGIQSVYIVYNYPTIPKK